MSHAKPRAIIGLLLLLALADPLLGANDQADDAQTAHAMAKQLGKTLKREITTTLDEQGRIQAIEHCHLKAPDIVKAMSDGSGWVVRRTSLKVRNLEDAPDKWELKVLKDFERLKAKGEPVGNLEYHEVVQKQGRRMFRYMKAISTKRVCLNCHGANLDSSVRAQLDSLYPFDQAIGFHLGDIRGAFSLSRPLGED